MAAQCKGCNQPIRWATNVETGKPIPLDPAPKIGGNVVLLEGDEARVLTRSEARRRAERSQALYVSHFSTCPKAGEFRGKGRR